MFRDEYGTVYYEESDVMFWLLGNEYEETPDETAERELRAEEKQRKAARGGRP